jgi:hypothetical protein
MMTDKLERFFIVRGDQVEERIDVMHGELYANRIVFRRYR